MRYLSLFSGLEAAHLALSPLGWTCVGVADIDPAACSLLAQRFPNIPNLGDVSSITAPMLEALGPIDVVIGGSPCQDLSVAGKRTGLAGARSSLFYQQVRIFNDARQVCGARWHIWENVRGATSSNGGRDFAAVVGSLAGCRLHVPAGGWGTEGVALGEIGLAEWSMLDARWFGLAQQRQRVFCVLDTGAWARRPAVLLESDQCRGIATPTRSGAAISRRTGRRAKAPRSSVIPVATADVVGCLSSQWLGSSNSQNAASHQLILLTDANGTPIPPYVRILTARESERLMGIPDDWTAVMHRGQPLSSNARRRLIGNSFAVPVVRWIGERIQAAHGAALPPVQPVYSASQD